MLTVEECLKELNLLASIPRKDQQGNVYEITNTWDRRFIEDVSSHAAAGQAISTAQGELAIKLIQRYRDHLVQIGIVAQSVDLLIQTPHYAQPPYQSTNLPREVRYAGDNKLVFRCKFNSGVIEDIKKLKGGNHFASLQYPTFNRDHKLWIVDVNANNWEKAMDVIKRHKFAFDDQVTNYFLEVSNSLSQKSSVSVEGDQMTVVVRNDDFLAAWISGVASLENLNV